ncbi:MAG: glycosyltransferase family 4 protein [Lachnospiraceae bacterium]|nr:glycosyltransferase family 4 protein [Lachnospiraceae bacterium]
MGTKVANYVYDVNYKVYSETVDHSTLVWLDKNLPIYCDRSDLILTISEFSKKQIEKYMKIKESKIQIVPCGVDCDKYKKLDIEKINFVKHKYGIAGDYILYMGTLEPRKNIVILIEAYYLMTQKKTNIPKLIIAGKRGWMYEQLFQKTLEYKLEDQIIFTGYIENDDCPVLMSGAELFVFPSLYEGFGIPPLEAMACGTPVIVSNADALLEAVGENAIYFCPMNAEELCKKINYLLENQDLREKLSFSGRKWAEKHSWKKAGEKLTAVLETV